MGCGRWRAPPSGLPVRRRRRPRGLQRGDRAPYLGYSGLPRVPFLKPGDVCTKNMPEAAVCCPLRGKSFAHRHASAHSSVSPRMCPAASCRGCFPKGAWPAKKGCPLQDLGAFPRLILSLPVARTRLLSSVPRQVAQNPMHSPIAIAQGKAPTRRPHSSNVSQSCLRTALNTIHIELLSSVERNAACDL